MAVKHDTFGERQKKSLIQPFHFEIILRESEVLKVPNKLGIQPCFAFLLFCMKLFCIRLRVWNTSNFPVEPPLPKFAFSWPISNRNSDITKKVFCLSVSKIQSLRSTGATCVIHVNHQIELKYFALSLTDQNTISNHTKPRKIIA